MKFRYQKLPFGGRDPRRPLLARPLIPIRLVRGTTATPTWFYALLDSGADRVLMPADLAPELGIADISAGLPEPIVGVGNARVEVYFHSLHAEVAGEGRPIPLEVGFARNIVIPLLGRSFFAHYRAVVFNERGNEVELKP